MQHVLSCICLMFDNVIKILNVRRCKSKCFNNVQLFVACPLFCCLINSRSSWKSTALLLALLFAVSVTCRNTTYMCIMLVIHKRSINFNSWSYCGRTCEIVVSCNKMRYISGYPWRHRTARYITTTPIVAIPYKLAARGFNGATVDIVIALSSHSSSWFLLDQ